MTYFIEAANITKNYKYPETSFFPHTVLIPLSLENDATYVSVVNIGDTVQEGQLIAKDSKGRNIHASVPGTVIDITPCYCPNGKQYYAVKIEVKGSFSYTGKKQNLRVSAELTKDYIISKLIEYSVLNTFDISAPENLGLQLQNIQKARNLVVRLFDEDNYRYTDSLIAKFYFDELLEGAKTIAKTIGAEGILFAYNSKDPMKEKFLTYQTDNIRFVGMNIKRYPSGTKREISSAYSRSVLFQKNPKLKVTRNDMYVDASCLYEVFKAINLNIPGISKPIFIYGNCLKSSCLLDVKLGTTLKDLINQTGGFIKEPKNIIINGLITGTSVSSLDVPITKYVKSVSFISKDKATDKHIFNCVNCGNCRFICPVKISPDIIYNNLTNFKELPDHISKTSLACTNCGLCNIECPARLPLCQSTMYLKTKLLEEGSKKNEK